MLRKLRVIAAMMVFGALTLFFLNIIDSFGILARVQLIPSLLAANILSLLMLGVVTLLMGRIYCSVLCPLGILQDIVDRIAQKRSKKKRRFTYVSAKNRWRYTFFAGTVLATMGGVALLLELLDPYSIFGRIITHLLGPVWLSINNLLAPFLEQHGIYLIMKQMIYSQEIEILLIPFTSLLLIVFLSGKYGRLYCNVICPAGTLLGILSRFSLFGIVVDQEKCNHCGLCASMCKASCLDSKNQKVDYSRCVDCFNCLMVCPQKALSFRNRFSEKTMDHAERSDTKLLSRRQFFQAGVLSVLGAAGIAARTAAAPSFREAFDENLPVLPPGAEGMQHFATHCTSCHLCISKCPNQVIQPGKFADGMKAVLQPVMDFKKGYCDYSCHLCGEICPAQAINKQLLSKKRRTRIGHVVYTKSSCVVETDGVSCGNCAIHCPVQAITMVDTEGKKFPVVDDRKCIGCGSCEYHCPANPRAMHVVGFLNQGQS